MSDWKKANEKWVLTVKSKCGKMWFWKDKGNVYDMSGTKIVPLTLRGMWNSLELSANGL